jgi:predicted nuclease of restriction endonuclease-like RecB superfamily
LLPSNLLITRKRGDKIRPVFAELNRQNLRVAELLVRTHEDYVGKKKGELKETLEELEDLGYDYRYVRGLSTLLERRCQLEPKTARDPIEARRQVFSIAHRKGLPTTPGERLQVLKQAALELDVDVEDLEESLYADLEDEFMVKGFEPVDPEALVKQYNLSLTQTLLFYSTELTFTTIGNWQQIFRQIKWLGLIYTVRRDFKGIHVRVDGPASIFKLNRRYGTGLAKLVPSIVQNREWSLKARILRKRERRLLNFELDSRRDGPCIEALKMRAEEKKETYDSQVERDFATRFKALETGWTLTREPEPIPAGQYVMIPDFGFQKGRSKVYMEVVGFWTQEYLKEKVKKLGLVGDIDMIVAVDEDLACSKLDRAGKKLNVLYYHRKIPLRPVLAHLRAREERLVEEQSKLLSVGGLVTQKPVVEVRELAETLGVLEEAVERVLEGKEFPGYLRLGDMFIRAEKMREIQELLGNRASLGELNLDEASRIIEEAGGRRPAQILDALGYRIDWKGIDAKSAKISKKSNTSPVGEMRHG